MPDKVDVLIIGAGASGAAVAWSLAETKMHIVCLEQGDWMNPAEYPATRRDAEARNGDSFAINPNRRARLGRLPDQRGQLADQGRKFQRSWRQHHVVRAPIRRASTPPTSGCERSMASPTTGRSTTRRWSRSTT